jgi:hypothetical protein
MIIKLFLKFSMLVRGGLNGFQLPIDPIQPAFDLGFHGNPLNPGKAYSPPPYCERYGPRDRNGGSQFGNWAPVDSTDLVSIFTEDLTESPGRVEGRTHIWKFRPSFNEQPNKSLSARTPLTFWQQIGASRDAEL